MRVITQLPNDDLRRAQAIWRCWEKQEPLEYRSAHSTLSLMTPNFSPHPTGLPRVPVSVAAIGPAMLHVAAEVCDGPRVHGLEALGEKLHRYPREGRSEEMAAEIPDEVIGLFAVVGTYDTIVGEIEKRYGGCADTIAFPTSPDLEPRALREVVETIQRIPSAFAGYAAGW
jgi:alkanesulfonate monooxygenase SsuD/methylene tetrahydromethanopterin reductase-like flavin-dependent oxidoreductase (luciferase family)